MIELSVSLASNGVVKVPGYEHLVRFGYTKNRGVYRLHVDATGEWEGLTIRAFWHVPDGKDPASSLVADGSVDVPASVTAQPGNGCITFEGSDGTKTVTSADLRYRVSANSGTEDGTMPEPGAPAWQQLVDAVHTDAAAAEQAKTDAQTAAREAAASAGNADQSAQEAADSLQELKDGIAAGNFKGEPGKDGKSPVIAVTDIENGHRVSITDKDGTKTIDVLNGKDGKDGTQIDDTTVGADAWSSKHIIDTLCPPLEETGNPVVFYPVAGYPLGCKASWEPTQEGSGDPSPDNVRPIKGRDSVTVERCGGNVIEFLTTNDYSSNISVVVDPQKIVTLNGVLEAKGNIDIAKCRLHWRSGKTYTMRVRKISGAVNLGAGDGITYAFLLFSEDLTHFFRGPTNTTNFNEYTATQTSLEETELFLMLQCWREGTKFDNYKFQIEVVEGTSVPTTYAPYIGQTAALTLPHTIYGGTVDAVTGDGQETWETVTLDGTEPWAQNTSVSNPYFIAPILHLGAFTLGSLMGICTAFPLADINASTNNNGFNGWNTALYIRWASLSTVDALKSYLATQYAAGTPVQVCYKPKTPTSFIATGAQPISALSGVNTLLTDADSATVTGRADPIKRITDLEDAVASMTTT
jgi:hypothetical protein